VKVTNSTENIGAFGGLNFISEKFITLKINSKVESGLGGRSAQSAYSYAAVIKNLWLLFLSGDGCAEDIEEHLRSGFLQIPNLKVCSADTIGRVLKNLKQEKGRNWFF
jgi:hypothetical protein